MLKLGFYRLWSKSNILIRLAELFEEDVCLITKSAIAKRVAVVRDRS